MIEILRFFQALWIFFLFLGCTLVFYYGIIWVSTEYNEYHRFDEPKGSSMKVIQSSLVEKKTEMPIIDRLQFFLIEGE